MGQFSQTQSQPNAFAQMLQGIFQQGAPQQGLGMGGVPQGPVGGQTIYGRNPDGSYNYNAPGQQAANMGTPLMQGLAQTGGLQDVTGTTNLAAHLTNNVPVGTDAWFQAMQPILAQAQNAGDFQTYQQVFRNQLLSPYLGGSVPNNAWAAIDRLNGMSYGPPPTDQGGQLPGTNPGPGRPPAGPFDFLGGMPGVPRPVLKQFDPQQGQVSANAFQPAATFANQQSPEMKTLGLQNGMNLATTNPFRPKRIL